MSIRHFHHFALSVPDAEAQKTFYQDFGLLGETIENRAVMRCNGRDQDQAVVVEGPERQLHHLSYGATEDGMAAIKANLDAHDSVNQVDSPKETPYDGIWLKDEDGMLYNINVSEPAPSLGGAAPTAEQPEFKVNSPGHYDRINVKGSPNMDLPVQPRRLGHLVHFTSDLEKKIAFYRDVLGFVLTDRAEDLIAFMRPPGGSDHHTIAMIRDEKTGFHHASFEVDNVDKAGLGGQRLLEKGYRNGWGLGRHALGSNFFWYIRDPHDGMCEYFADMDYIADDDEWQPRDWELDVSFFLWGPEPPQEFGMNFEGTKKTIKPQAKSGARN